MQEERKIDLLFAASFLVGTVALILLGFNMITWTILFIENKAADLTNWTALIGFLLSIEAAFRLQDHIEARLAKYWRAQN